MAARLRPHHYHEANHVSRAGGGGGGGGGGGNKSTELAKENLLHFQDIHGVYLESPEQVSMTADYQPIRISDK